MRKILGIMLGLGLACAVQADIVEGDIIGIDFGATVSTDPGNTWNHFSVGGDASTPGMTNKEVKVLSSLNNTAGSAVSGVGFSVSNATGQIAWDFPNGVAGDPSGDTIITHSSVYLDALISNDASGRTTQAGVDFFVFTFTGLDDSLTYKLGGGFDNNNSNFETDWSADGQSIRMYPQFKAYKTLEGLSTDGNGNLEITVTGVGGAAHITVSALTLEAIPEPATLGLVAAFGGAIMFIRRRMKM